MTKRNRKGKGAGIEWLRAHVNYQGDECLIFPLKAHRRGYAVVGLDGEQPLAGRVMCEMVHGPAPSPEHEAAHSCGRGKFGCVDPRHLSWKTISENALDCRGHGTQARNMAGNRGYLTDGDVAEIKALEGYLTQVEIAAMFNTSPPTVRDIFTGRSRTSRGFRKPFTPQEVLEIRQSNQTPRELAGRFNTTACTIGRIKRRISYADIGDGQSVGGGNGR